jgi:hypothetical protein
MSYPRIWNIAAIVGLLALSAAWPSGASLAQQNAGTSSAKAATPTPDAIDPDWFKLPATPGKFNYTPALNQPAEPNSKIALPNNIKIGKSELQFDAGRRPVNADAFKGIDNSGSTVLNTQLDQQKGSQIKPNYFGFTLSVPTH